MFGFVVTVAITSAASDVGVRLSVTGDPGTQFDLECTTGLSNGSSAIAYSGAVPYERRLPWDGAACTVRQTSATGGLQIEMRSGGNVTVSRIRSGGGMVTVRFGSRTSRSD